MSNITISDKLVAAQRADRLQKAYAAYMNWLTDWAGEKVRDNNTRKPRPRLSLSTFEKARDLADAWFGLIELDELPQFSPKFFGPMRAKFKSLCYQHSITDLLRNS